MKIFRLFALLISSSVVVLADAKTEEAGSLVREYRAAIVARDASRIARLFHPEVQAVFKDGMIKDALMSKGFNSTADALRAYGVSSAADLTQLSPEAATERSFRRIFALYDARARKMAESMRVHVVGVIEEEKTYYVVFRLAMDVQQAALDTAQVVMLREHEGNLRLIVTSEIQGLRRLNEQR